MTAPNKTYQTRQESERAVFCSCLDAIKTVFGCEYEPSFFFKLNLFEIIVGSLTIVINRRFLYCFPNGTICSNRHTDSITTRVCTLTWGTIEPLYGCKTSPYYLVSMCPYRPPQSSWPGMRVSPGMRMAPLHMS